MAAAEKRDSIQFYVLLAFSFMLPVLTFAAWSQAVAFDPCDNIFKPPAYDCIASPIIPAVGGSFAIFLGGGFVWGAVRNGKRELGNWHEPALIGWIGLCFILFGAAMIYAAFGMGLF